MQQINYIFLIENLKKNIENIWIMAGQIDYKYLSHKYFYQLSIL